MKANHERHPTDHERRWLLAIEAEMSYTGGRWPVALSMLDAFIAESEAGSPHYLDSVALNPAQRFVEQLESSQAPRMTR
jgi:hypothetical protein